MITIWHNPRCSKSREALKLLEEQNIEADVFKYLDAPLSKEDITALLKKLSISARELMRTKEDVYKELNLKEVDDEDKLIDAMVANPRLIERPIIIEENRAVIGRPIEKVIDFIK
jgi:arsenate reductase